MNSTSSSLADGALGPVAELGEALDHACPPASPDEFDIVAVVDGAIERAKKPADLRMQRVSELNAPDELKHLPGWLVWRRVKGEDGRDRKVPYYTSGAERSGQNGSPSDRARLTTFEAARSAAARRGFDGVGLALMPEFGITVLDFDDCVNGGQVNPEVLRMVSDTYAELSPSGTGVHAVYRGSAPNAKSYSSPERWGFETFSSKGFVTWTGNVLEVCKARGCSSSVAPINDQVMAEVNRRFGHRDAPREPSSTEPLGLTLEQARNAVEQLDPDMGFEHWLRVGMALHHELGAEGLNVWDQWSARGAKYRGNDDLMTHWRTFGRGRSGTPVTMRTVGKMLGRPLDGGAASAEEFDALAEEGGQGGESAANSRFAPIPLSKFLTRSKPRWHVKGLIPQAELVMVYGSSGDGKSFWTLDVVSAIARRGGGDWCGRKVQPGRVAYVVAEGAGGFVNRIAAYLEHNGLQPEDLDLEIIPAAPNLAGPKDVAQLIAGLKARGPFDLVVLDTLAAVSPGVNENSSEMNPVLSACRSVHTAVGATVILVHHAGKDVERGARGWSGIRAAMDAEIEIARSGDMRSARITKMKDGADDAQPTAFRLQQVHLGVDEDGEAETSCVVIHEGIAVPEVKPRGEAQKKVFDKFKSLAEFGSVSLEALVEACVELWEPPQDGKKDRRKELARKAIVGLVNRRVLRQDLDELSLPAGALARGTDDPLKRKPWDADSAYFIGDKEFDQWLAAEIAFMAVATKGNANYAMPIETVKDRAQRCNLEWGATFEKLKALGFEFVSVGLGMGAHMTLRGKDAASVPVHEDKSVRFITGNAAFDNWFLTSMGDAAFRTDRPALLEGAAKRKAKELKLDWPTLRESIIAAGYSIEVLAGVEPTIYRKREAKGD